MAVGLSEDTPATIAARIPILVRDERWIIRLTGIIAPERYGIIDTIDEFQIVRVAERGIIDNRSILLRCELERLAKFAGCQGWTAIRSAATCNRRGIISVTGSVGVIAIERDVGN